MCFPDEYTDDEYLICFDRMNLKGPYGRYGDHNVYVDVYSEVKISYGDQWYCNLIEMETTNGFRYYFANPVYKVGNRNGLLVDLQIPETKESDFTAGVPEEDSMNSIVNKESKKELESEPFGFVAIGGDMIYSPRLTATRYNVYRSFNGEHFEIIPDENGNIPCIRNSIALESLDDILDCEFPVRLDCRMKEDHILLNLTQ